MRTRLDLEQYLAREVLDREIPRKPPTKERRGPARDAEYRAWIRTWPCAACGSTLDVEAAHTGSDGGMSMKSSDYSCIPLCTNCHRLGRFAYHRIGRPAFMERWRMDLTRLVLRLNALWRSRTDAPLDPYTTKSFTRMQ